MALVWLDLVRYADSVGYHSDNARPMWRYRDWVVSAFNRNLPFDRFTAEQLAGDLLAGERLDAEAREQRIASGYNRLLQTTEEGGAQPREYRAIYLADRVRNASSVWLGATLGCAQCHDHKFDPYLARDFYAFAAFFADVKEEPVGRRKLDPLPDAAQKPSLDALDARIEELRAALDARQPTPEWERALAARRVHRFTTLEPVSARSARGTRVMIQGNDFSIIASTAHGPKPPTDTYTVRFETELERLTAIRLEALTFEELPRGGPGRDPRGGFVVSEIELRDAAGRSVALRGATASFESGASRAAAAIDGRTRKGGWGLREADGESHRLVAELAQPLVRSGGTITLDVVLHQNDGALRTLGRFRVAGSADEPPVRTGPGVEPSADLVAWAALERSARSGEQQKALAKHYRRAAPELQADRAALRAAELAREAFLEAVTRSYVTTTLEPEPVRVLPRGNWLSDAGELVPPAVPAFLAQLMAQARPEGQETGGARATRLDLARWLTASENPLTARVLANRLFRLCFGHGLSRTVEDLGAQGEWPSHPELLDWLALELRDGGWDVKRLLRTLVTSSAYRQSSALTAELVEKDPDNRLLARQSRFRLDAELVRDNALAVSGLLAPALGGPSVFPYQPPGYWAHLNFPPREWDASPGADQYRRGLYTWWQRSFPQPSLAAFDAPSREECTGLRVRSNVPQQALALLNDPSYVEAARVLAERILSEGGTSFEARVRFAYGRALQRAPNAAEQRTVAALLSQSRAAFARDPASARRLVSVGQQPVAKGLPVVDLAAWTQVARAILNLPELVTRS
jgi:hypothetical protein